MKTDCTNSKWGAVGLLYASNAIEAGASLLVNKLVYLLLGVGAFAEFMLVKRIISFIVPALILGQGVVLTRRIASTRPEDAEMRTGLILNAAFIVFGCLAAVSIPANYYWHQIAGLAFGGNAFDLSASSLLILTLGYLSYGLSYSAVRGLARAKLLSVCQAFIGGLLPVALVSMAPRDINSFFVMLGSALALSSLLLILIAFGRTGKCSCRLSSRIALEQLVEGLKRIPGDLSFYAIMALPTTIVAWHDGLEASATVAIAFVVLGLATSLTAPFSALILPMTASGELSKWLFTRALAASLIPAAIISGCAYAWADQVIMLLSGHELTKHVSLFKILILGLPALCAYSLFRNILDGSSNRPISGHIATVSFIIMLVAWTALVDLGGTGIALGCVCAFYALMGLSTVAILRRRQHGGGFT